MITHIVMLKLKDRSRENAEKVRATLMPLRNKIPQIRHYEVGVNVVESARAYDVALYSKFDSLDDLQIYQDHPNHVEALKYIRTVIESSAAVDYES
jgi:hypothetical protein